MTEILRHADTDPDIAACFPVMRVLRPHIASPEELAERVRAQMLDRYRILAAWNGTMVVGLAGYRFQSNLIRGLFCYVDDLVVAPDHRRFGLGARLLDAVATEARGANIATEARGVNIATEARGANIATEARGANITTEARGVGVKSLVLDTAMDNALGQRFYFRYGMLPGAMRFVKRLD